jgi:2-polyprenyl-3-methyl-5-hydroxy-6-metoxy-1,4-benzoquinol methylase
VPVATPNEGPELQSQALLFIGAKAKARILDVGSGVGRFVKMMNRFGYDNALGIDPFLDQSAERPHVRRSDIQSVKGIYDVILFNHCFEHMTEPEAALKRCGDLLSPSGTVVVHIPNPHSREFEKFKQDWWGLHAPYHFALPSRKGTELMAARCGFKVADAVCTSRYDHYLYSDDYRRNIPDKDLNSVRRKLENETFDKTLWSSLSKLAYSLNKTLEGDWIAYYLVRD